MLLAKYYWWEPTYDLVLVHGDEQPHIVGQDGQQVHPVHDLLDELELVWAGDQPDKELRGEPDVDDTLQDGKRKVVRPILSGELWQGVEGEDDGGDENGQGGGDGYSLKVS